MSNRKTAQCQINAVKAYHAKALESVSFLLSPHEREIFEALQIIKAHHHGNRAQSVKTAILHYAQSLQPEKT